MLMNYTSRCYRIWILSLLVLAAMSSHAYEFTDGTLFYNSTVSMPGDPNYYGTIGVTYKSSDWNWAKSTVRIPRETEVRLADGRRPYKTVNEVCEAAFKRSALKTAYFGWNGESYVRILRRDAFRGSPWLATVELSRTLTTIEHGAFADCPSLRQIDLCSGRITSVGDSAFSGCTALDTLLIPPTMVSIGNGAFAGCSAIKRIELKPRAEADALTIGNHAFAGCSSIDTIMCMNFMPPVVADVDCFDEAQYAQTVVMVPYSALGRYRSHPIWGRFAHLMSPGYDIADNTLAYRRVALDNDQLQVSGSLKQDCISINVPSNISSHDRQWSVTQIGKGAFKNQKLSTIKITQSITEIGDSAFYNNTGLYAFYGGGGLTRVGKSAFENCGFLSLNYTIFDAAHLRFIGNRAFRNAIKQETLEVLPCVPDSMGSEVFADCTSLKTLYFTKHFGNLKIGDRNFAGCTALNAVILGEHIDTLTCGKDAFAGCSNLRFQTLQLTPAVMVGGHKLGTDVLNSASVYVPMHYAARYRDSEGWGLFAHIKPLNYDFKIAKSYYRETTGDEVAVTYYERADGYETTMPETVTDCDGVVHRVTEIADSAYLVDNYYNYYYFNFVIPGTIKRIGRYAFVNCEMRSLTIADGVESIGSEAFRAARIAAIHLPKTVTSIGEQAFLNNQFDEFTVDPANPVYDSRDNCNALVRTADNTLLVACKNTTIPQGVTTIATNAFYFLYDKNPFEFPSSLTHVQTLAFYGCGVEELYIPSTITQIDDGAFSLNYVQRLTIGEGITEIPPKAFQGLINLKKLKLPGTLKKIDEWAFTGSTLTHVVVPNSVDTISDYAFALSLQLDTLELGSGLKFIGQSAFDNVDPHYSIDHIVCHATEPPTFGALDVFQSSYSSATLSVPAASLQAYRDHTGWRQFAHIIPITSSVEITQATARVVAREYYDLDGHRLADSNGAPIVIERACYDDGHVVVSKYFNSDR